MKVVFDLAAQQISIEGDGEKLLEVLEAARNLAPHITHIQIHAGAPPKKSQEKGPPASGNTSNGAGGATQTLKQFVRSLRLDNTAERVAAIAYHVKHQENRESFSPKEMGSWFTIAGLQKPKQMPVAMFAAKKRHGYVDSAGHGKFRLATNGENLVTSKMNDAEGSVDEE
ncbi:MAG: hypothetical protein K8T25_00460 [Planctomycetia bacterium]|nr:hypothetical protein [Planctomycetia bacterium]